jgi:hypothetical protein
MRRKGSIVRLLGAACVGGLFLAGSCLAGEPKPEDVKKVEAALPEKAPATPKKARKVLIFGNAQGFVHSSIELGEETIAKLGEKTGAYTSTISNDPAVFDDLSGYDAVMLVSTTGHFLLPRNAPADKATDYKDKEKQRFDNLIKFVKDGKGLAGIHAASDAYYDFPEWGEVIGGYFNGHPWGNVTVKIDDPKSPITAGFEGKSFEIQDETYTFKKEPWSRDKLHILTSLDASTIKGGENRPYDHDYGISWIHEVGKGRVFYCAHGHSEHVYWEKPMLQEYLAGLQYVLGDLEADATPSGAAKTADAK